MSTTRGPGTNAGILARLEARVFNLERVRPDVPSQPERWSQQFSMGHPYVSESGRAYLDFATRLLTVQASLNVLGGAEIDVVVNLSGTPILAETLDVNKAEWPLFVMAGPSDYLTVEITDITGTPAGFVVVVFGAR